MHINVELQAGNKKFLLGLVQQVNFINVGDC